MKDTLELVEVAIDSQDNASLQFLPVNKKVRGRFDLRRTVDHDSKASMLMSKWPQPIPGQRIGVNVKTGEGYIVDGLYEPAHAATRERIEALKFKLPPERQTFSSVHLPTWLYWLKRAVDAGVARVVKGELPETLDGEPRTSFHIQRQKDQSKLLVDALDRQTEAMVRQSELLAQQADAFTKILAALTKKI